MIRQIDNLNTVVASVIDTVHPWRIVLFGSRARGTQHDQSDYDLYVEVEDTGESLKETRNRIWRLIAGQGLTFDLKVERAGTIERRRDDPGTIEWDVAREGRVLHAAPGAPRNLAPPMRVREPSPLPPESMYEWIALAETDLRHATHLWSLEEEFPAAICELSQRMCEKFMKALLVSRHVRPKRTHDLNELLAALRSAGCPLPGLDADCERLTKHAVAPRYGSGLELGAEDAQAAFEAASRVVAAVRAELPPSIH